MSTDTLPAVEEQADEQQQEQEQSDATVLDERKREHYEAISAVNDLVMQARMDWSVAKEEASEAKKQYDGLVSQLSILIKNGPDAQCKLPFGDQDEDTLQWRERPVTSELGLTIGELEKLEEAGVTLMGELEDLRGGDGLTSVKGIGQATADKIEEQLLDWLSQNRDGFGEVVEDGQADVDDEDATE